MIELYNGWKASIREATWDDYLQRDQLVSTREVTYGEALSTRIEVVPAEVYQYEIWLVCEQLINPDGIALEDMEGGERVRKDKDGRYRQAKLISFLGSQSPRFVIALHKEVIIKNPNFVGNDDEGNDED